MGCKNSKHAVTVQNGTQPTRVDNNHPTPTPTSIVKENQQQKVSIHDQNLFEREARQKNASSCVMICLDANINGTEDNRRFVEDLRQITDRLLTFDSVEECEEKLLVLATNHEKIYLIVNGSLGEIFVPKIDHIEEVEAIFVFCDIPNANQEYAKNYSKVRSVHNGIISLKAAIQAELDNQSDNTNSMPMQIVEYTHSIGNSFLVTLEPIVDGRFRPPDILNNKENLVGVLENAYIDDLKQLEIIKEFDKQYTPSKAIWWYTRESCIYQYLNRILRLQDEMLIYFCLSFIIDLYNQLKVEHEKFVKLHKNENSIVHVYRGQIIRKEELKKISENIGRFITMNTFLSTSLKQDAALAFLATKRCSYEFVLVLFEIEIDTRIQETKPYADISDLSYFPSENEILFMLGTLFKIEYVDQSANDKSIVKLSLCSEGYDDMKNKREHIKRTMDEPEIIQKGISILDAGEKILYFRNVLNSPLPSDCKISSCYFWLGKSLLYDDNDKYEEAIDMMTKAVDVCESTDYSRLVKYSRALAKAYLDRPNYEMAMQTYEKILPILLQYLPEEHFGIATTFAQIGYLHSIKTDYDKALMYAQKALSTYLKVLPKYHQQIAESYHNIGYLYDKKKDYQNAIVNYTKAIEIYRDCVPSAPELLQDATDMLKNAYDSLTPQQHRPE